MASCRVVHFILKVPWTYDDRFKNPCWYEKDGLKCLPYYFIIGVKKCGTTALHTYLMKHPESIRLFKKEMYFFAGNRNSKFIQDLLLHALHIYRQY